MIINELISTEKTYVDGLSILDFVYLTPLMSSKKHSNEILEIHQQIDKLKTIHSTLLDNLKKAVEKDPNQPLIGDIIIKFCPNLEQASVYIFNYPKYLEIVTKLMSDQSYVSLTKKTAEEYQKTHGSAFIQNVQQYLIMPIQRVPRYVLLITDMLRNISLSFGDAPQLIGAHRTMKKVATDINDKGHEYEADEKMRFVKTILTNFNPRIIKRREFICCGPLYVITNKEEVPKNWKYFFLFSDSLVITEITHYSFVLL